MPPTHPHRPTGLPRRMPRIGVAAATATALLLAGCGAAADKASEKATEQLVESQTGGDVDIDTADGSVEIETEDGSMSFGTGEVPAEWPEDIPLPDGLEVLSGSTSDSSDGRLVGIVGTATASPEDILATMKDELADWTISGESTVTGTDGSITGAQWETDGRRVNFAATAGPDGETSITLSHTTLS